MKILCIRHGKSDLDDLDGLTNEGKLQIRNAANILKNRVVIDDANTDLLTSPLLRARQSAEILAEECGLMGGIVQVNWLSCEDEESRKVMRRLRERLNAPPYQSSIILVSHEPVLEEIVASFGNLFLIGSGEVFEIDTATGICRKLE